MIPTGKQCLAPVTFMLALLFFLLEGLDAILFLSCAGALVGSEGQGSGKDTHAAPILLRLFATYLQLPKNNQ